MTSSIVRRLAPLSLLLAACASPAATVQTAPAPAVRVATGDSARVAARLLPVRWYRAAAEQRAAYLQAYRQATAALERRSAGKAGAWGVIMDADETVLDNSRYQQERALADSDFTPATWNAFVARRVSAALPGAAAFIAAVKAKGGRVVIVTNRTDAQCPDTRANFRALGIVVDTILCRTTTDDKNPRFDAVQAGTVGLPPLDVVMWVGDNIQDFPHLTQAIRAGGDDAFAPFGDRFIVLPNPMYGSWGRNALP